jgi:phage shock protein A
MKDMETDAAFDRVRMKVMESDAHGHGQSSVSGMNVEQQFAAMERAERVEKLLAELKKSANAGD